MTIESNDTHKAPIVDQVYSDIKRRIIRGDLKPNAKLCVRELCEYYNISDTPLKQALNRLVAERLVEALPRRGMRVRCITQKDIHEALETRMMIELYAIPFVLQSTENDDTVLKRLEENLKRNEELIKATGNFFDYSDKAMEELEISREFHTIMVECIGNCVILDFYQSTVKHQYVFYQYGKDKANEVLASLNEHKKIFSFLKARDEEGLRATIIEHRKVREKDATSAMTMTAQNIINR